uniref:phosphatidate phosphatase n=1 Tax=Oreochromis niloticus TaxID=8128 RepID=A0A669CP68_ORENI
MNFVGQLAGQVFVQVKELYRGLNPATLSGCIDVIVVRQPDGSLQCSPFHVRFGKLGVLRSREKVVDMEINGEPVDLHMKLGENGEAFFVQETENDQEVVPSYLATSPILSDGPVLMGKTSGTPIQNLCSVASNGENSSVMMKKRRKRRRKARADNLRREESGDYSADEDMFPIDISSDEAAEMESNRSSSRDVSREENTVGSTNSSFKQAGMYTRSDGEWSPIQSPGNSRPTSPKSDSELIGKPSNADNQNPEMHWAWGELPQAAMVGKSRHLGSDGIYLDDITELEPEVAALYFPKRKVSYNPGLHSTSQSPQSVSSGGDSGVDSYCDHMSDLPSIAISLCGGLNDNREITKEQFYEKIVSYQQFTDNPSIIDDPNLVVKIGSKYYNWNTAAPLVLAMQAFQKPLPKAAVENIMKEKMPKKGGRWWFSWRSRNSSAKSVIQSDKHQPGTVFITYRIQPLSVGLKEESSSSDEDHREAKQNSSPIQTEPVLTTGGVSYKKTLRLTSEQLLSLQLQDGPNDVVFSVTTQYQGTCRCQGTIYLWNWDDKIIISDIDGTITRSDTLGHILPTLGKDWTHQGIAQLYHKVSQNGYKFLYCSARAIGMADMTRGYLNWVNERGTMLPIGPVLLSPSSLFSALHREVIEKKPEKFKVECLTDIKNLFYPNKQPFYAAFGNRPTDVYSYKEVGVSLNRIFTVNPKGELVQEHAKTNISSYVRLCEVVDHVFPLKARASSSDFPCSDTYSHFTYWREQFPLVDNQETTPQQTASSSS